MTHAQVVTASSCCQERVSRPGHAALEREGDARHIYFRSLITQHDTQRSTTKSNPVNPYNMKGFCTRVDGRGNKASRGSQGCRKPRNKLILADRMQLAHGKYEILRLPPVKQALRARPHSTASVPGVGLHHAWQTAAPPYMYIYIYIYVHIHI